MIEERLISSEHTHFYKWSNYLILGLSAYLFIKLAYSINSLVVQGAILAIIVLLGLFMLHQDIKHNGSIVDKVYDDGDFLRVIKHDKEQKIPFSNLANVTSQRARYANQVFQIITLHLQNPGEFGTQILFVVKGNSGFFFPDGHPLAEELRRRAQSNLECS